MKDETKAKKMGTQRNIQLVWRKSESVGVEAVWYKWKSSVCWLWFADDWKGAKKRLEELDTWTKSKTRF